MNAEQCNIIEKLFFDMYEMLKSYALSVLKEESLAEEAVQETFRIACQQPEKLVNSPNPKGWLVNTLKFTIRNMKRVRENAQQLLMKYISVQTESIVFSKDDVSLDVLYQDVANLEEFKLIKEMAIEGRSHLEMANARGITVTACKKRVQRAKAVLKKKLK